MYRILLLNPASIFIDTKMDPEFFFFSFDHKLQIQHLSHLEMLNVVFSISVVIDVKRKVWVPVSSVPAHCGYSLQRKGKGVVFSSPLPACHSYAAVRK